MVAFSYCRAEGDPLCNGRQIKTDWEGITGKAACCQGETQSRGALGAGGWLGLLPEAHQNRAGTPLILDKVAQALF